MRQARFGPFEVDFETGELRKHGLRIKLQEKPLRVLEALVEKPGRLVSREELQRKLWPKDLYVDFERNLTIAMNKLRSALSDSAEKPRYIETLPRRGYRFIAEVEVIVPEAVPALAPTGSAPALVRAEEGVQLGAPALRTPPNAVSAPKRLGLAIGVTAVLVAAIILLGIRLNRVSPGEPSVGAPPHVRIVVLPFVNLTGDERREYLCDGLTEEMIAELSRVSPGRLEVIARTSAMQYKRTGKSVAQIGRELNVSYLLEGSVREFGDRVRVTTQLVRASDAGHVWSGEYDRDVRDALQLQQQVAMAIAGEIKLTLSPQASARPRNAHEVNPEAYRQYLLGRKYWNERIPSSLTKSVACFRQAIQYDPNFALAYAGLADSLQLNSTPEMVVAAKDAARRAIDLDPTLGEPHASLGFIALRRDWDWAESEREFRRALQFNPNYPTAHHWFAFYFETTGQMGEAIRELNRALELDPLSPVIRGALADGLLKAGQQDKALEEIQKVLEMDPGFAQGHRVRALIYERKRMFPEAIEELNKAGELGVKRQWTVADLAYARALAGQRAAAEETIRDLERRAKRAGNPPPAEDIAMIYVGLGNLDQAFAWLEKAREQRSELILGLKADPAFDPLRSDPRFQALVHRVGLPP